MVVGITQGSCRRTGEARVEEEGPCAGRGNGGDHPTPNASSVLGGRNNAPGNSPTAISVAEPNTPVPDTVNQPRLWREVAGEQIRQIRTNRAERLADVAERAGVSPQYLSEIERGVKDPSSEVLAAVAGALGTSVEGLARRAYRLAPVLQLSAAPHLVGGRRAPAGPVLLAA